MTKFPKIAGLTLTAVIVTGFFSVAAQKNRIVGTYLSCEMACQAIQIRADGTFQHLFDGDLYNNERTGGTWKLIGHNRIKAWSPNRCRRSSRKRRGAVRMSYLPLWTPKGRLSPVPLSLLLQRTEALVAVQTILDRADFTHQAIRSRSMSAATRRNTKLKTEIRKFLRSSYPQSCLLQTSLTISGSSNEIRFISSEKAKSIAITGSGG